MMIVEIKWYLDGNPPKVTWHCIPCKMHSIKRKEYVKKKFHIKLIALLSIIAVVLDSIFLKKKKFHCWEKLGNVECLLLGNKNVLKGSAKT